jgi:para-aminobenzoate synthetase component 1
MLLQRVYKPEQIEVFKLKALAWAAQFDNACCLESNEYHAGERTFDTLISAGHEAMLEADTGNALEQLDDFIKDADRIIPGFLSYDLKNEIEALESNHHDGLDFPDLFFFIPKHQLLFNAEEVAISSANPEAVYQSILATTEPSGAFTFNGLIKSRFNREAYVRTVENLQQHIRRGDIYEINLCQEFYSENYTIDPLAAFLTLNRISPTPFANFFKKGSHFIISATPERFLKRKQNRLISQPIKGTAKRNPDSAADEINKNALLNSEKERSENVMIVDLVRNDLTKCALPGTVRVDELFGIYTFPQVHQMISTISCQIDEQTPVSAILKSTFPMGSMTGAPKISAMKLIERFEKTKRGVYSGSVGYFRPNGDFDFNVIIRTILYNAAKNYLSFQVGSAITHLADAEQEYEECLLKAKAIFKVLGQETI